MINPVSRRAQRGATLVVGLIMLVLITLMVTTAFMLSTGNLKAVGNMQFRGEALAAANRAIEQVLASPFINDPAAAEQQIPVDIDNDGQVDYTVAIAAPACVRATIAAPSASSSITLGAAMSTSSFWNTVWDINASVNDTVTGASIQVRQGVRVLLSRAQKEAVCL
jgi:Tfp pilus assembly protein PilX